MRLGATERVGFGGDLSLLASGADCYSAILSSFRRSCWSSWK